MKTTKILCASLMPLTFTITTTSLLSCSREHINDNIIVDKTTIELDPVNSSNGYYGEMNFTLPEQPFDDLVDVILSNHKDNKARVNFLNKTTRNLKIENKKINIKFCIDEVKNVGENKFDLTFIYKDVNYNVHYKKITDLSLKLISVPPIETTGYTCFYAYKKSIFKLVKSAEAVVLPDCSFSTDKTNWNKYNENQTLVIQPGQKLYLKGNNPNGWSKKYLYTTISIEGEVAIGGNVMSLLSNDENGLDTIPCEYCFAKLFESQACITYVNKNFFPAMHLKNNCYQQAFKDCTALKKCVDLPATQLTDYCYAGLFHGCLSMLDVPEQLPAIELKPHCYDAMFEKCKSIVNAPKLLFTKAASYSCSWMFANCEKMAPPEDLTVSELADYCYDNMFYACSSISTMPKLNNMTLAKGCYSGMFSSCGNLTNTSKLPAVELAEKCYYNMFSGSGIITHPELAMVKMAPYCCESMFSGCDLTSTIDFSKSYQLAEGCFSSMYEFCKKLEFSTTTIGTQTVLPKDCFSSLFFGCTNLKMIKVGFVKWVNDQNEQFTKNWVDAIHPYMQGIFCCPEGLEEIFDKDHIPVNNKFPWLISHEKSEMWNPVQ